MQDARISIFIKIICPLPVVLLGAYVPPSHIQNYNFPTWQCLIWELHRIALRCRANETSNETLSCGKVTISNVQSGWFLCFWLASRVLFLLVGNVKRYARNSSASWWIDWTQPNHTWCVTLVNRALFFIQSCTGIISPGSGVANARVCCARSHRRVSKRGATE